MDEKLKKHGSISWKELVTHSPKAAKKFYGELFGWRFEDMPMKDNDGAPYSVVKIDGDEVAGIMKFPPGAPPIAPAWGLYVTVDNLDEAAEKAIGLGAKIALPPMNIPDVGRFCVLQDPQGAFISIISYTIE